MDNLFPSIDDENNTVMSLGSSESFLPVFESIEYKVDQILDKIRNIDDLNEQEIKNIIVRQYHMILDYDLFLANERKYALELFTNERFLRILLDVIGTLELSNDEIICINKITYDYYVLRNKNQVISNLLLDLSYFVNNRTAIRLSAVLGIQGARVLAMIAKSSFKLEKNIHRINRFIVKCNIALSLQDVINIYCTLFDSFMYPIIYTMLEVQSIDLTPEEIKRFDTISVTVVKLLDAMTSDDIYKVLSNYAYMLQLMEVKRTRFSLKELCKEYNMDRISKIIYQIELDTMDNPVEL